MWTTAIYNIHQSCRGEEVGRGGEERWTEEGGGKDGRWERDRQMKGGVGEWEEWIDGEEEELTDRGKRGAIVGQCEINNEVGMSES